MQILFVISCVKEIDINPRFFEQKVVVNTLFTPDEPFVFHFSYTIPPDASGGGFNDTIHLFLYENNTQILDTIFSSDSLMTSVYPKPESSYLLKVFVEGYDTIYARDTIPRKVLIHDGTIIWSIAIDKYNTHISQVSITFSDPPGERNYYELFVGNGSPYSSDIEITDPVLINEGDMGYFPESYFFSDELFDGQQYTMIINRELGHGAGRQVNAVLRNISYSYYLFRKYWARHRFNQIGIDREIGYLIYMGEPQSMYNNIQNGYGIFACYVENTPLTLRSINK